MTISLKAKKKVKATESKMKNRKREIKVNASNMLIFLWVSMLSFIASTVTYAFPERIIESENGFLSIIVSAVDCIAFPLLGFWLVERYAYIEESNADKAESFKSKKNFFFKLLFMALICELPYDAVKNSSALDFSAQNVFFTIAVSFLLIAVMGKTFDIKFMSHAKDKQKKYNTEIKFIIAALIIFATAFANFEYGGEGVALLAILNIARKKKRKRLFQFLAFVLYIIGSGNVVNAFSLITLIFIYIIDMRKKNSTMPENKFRNRETAGGLIYLIQLVVFMLLKITTHANLVSL